MPSANKRKREAIDCPKDLLEATSANKIIKSDDVPPEQKSFRKNFIEELQTQKKRHSDRKNEYFASRAPLPSARTSSTSTSTSKDKDKDKNKKPLPSEWGILKGGNISVPSQQAATAPLDATTALNDMSLGEISWGKALQNQSPLDFKPGENPTVSARSKLSAAGSAPFQPINSSDAPTFTIPDRGQSSSFDILVHWMAVELFKNFKAFHNEQPLPIDHLKFALQYLGPLMDGDAYYEALKFYCIRFQEMVKVKSMTPQDEQTRAQIEAIGTLVSKGCVDLRGTAEVVELTAKDKAKLPLANRNAVAQAEETAAKYGQWYAALSKNFEIHHPKFEQQVLEFIKDEIMVDDALSQKHLYQSGFIRLRSAIDSQKKVIPTLMDIFREVVSLLRSQVQVSISFERHNDAEWTGDINCMRTFVDDIKVVFIEEAFLQFTKSFKLELAQFCYWTSDAPDDAKFSSYAQPCLPIVDTLVQAFSLDKNHPVCASLTASDIAMAVMQMANAQGPRKAYAEKLAAGEEDQHGSNEQELVLRLKSG